MLLDTQLLIWGAGQTGRLSPAARTDPFDRMLIAQAAVEGAILPTADATLARYPGRIERVQ